MQTLSASEYGLFPHLLSPAILDVLSTLTRAGYDAYIVGGGVRDLLLGLKPKDFDAVTNATPAQIRQVFGKRCRIIGRRFELVHVFSGRDMIEVATFRAPPVQSATTDAGMITRDNVWGTIEQDAARRDFCINSLYYQPQKNQILDFGHAMRDLEAKKIRFLGKPAVRVEEDPVRLLRVLRFAAKLNFSLDAGIAEQMRPERTALLKAVSPHRLYDETQKMFGGGYLMPLLPLLIQYGIWERLFAAPPIITPFILKAAESTDNRLNAGKSVNPAFFYAVLLWQPMLDQLQEWHAQGHLPHDAWSGSGIAILRKQQQLTAIPRFAEAFIREMWELQLRLVQPRSRQIPSIAAHPRFRAAFDFLYLREQSGDPETHGMGEWWQQYQSLNNDQREHAIRLLSRQQLRTQKAKVKAQGAQTEQPPSFNALADTQAQLHTQTADEGERIQLMASQTPMRPEKRKRVRKPRVKEPLQTFDVAADGIPTATLSSPVSALPSPSVALSNNEYRRAPSPFGQRKRRDRSQEE